MAASPDSVCRGARFRCPGHALGQAAAGVVRGECRESGCSVASAFASAAGAGGLVEWPVVDGLAEVDLPRFREAAGGVPGVQPDEVVSDEREGEQGGRRGEAGHPG